MTPYIIFAIAAGVVAIYAIHESAEVERFRDFEGKQKLEKEYELKCADNEQLRYVIDCYKEQLEAYRKGEVNGRPTQKRINA